MADPYVPLHGPFWTDGVFQVHERSEGRYTASRVNGMLYFQGDLKACALWIERERENN